ncbi:MAG: phosphoglycerate kinase [Candidatus Thermoplasmatota archaeon]|nr:phosphoglycerate kinase [Candidatus Thermoplasmatota archaeon]
MEEFNTLDDFNFENRTVLLRVDFNMPLDKKTLHILDATRMNLVIPTINELIKKKAKIVILAHQGRKDSWDFISMEDHAKKFGTLINKKVKYIDDIFGNKAKKSIKELKYGEILFLDNVRKIPYETLKKTAFEHSKSEFIQDLYPLADFFVNDAFAAAHRSQCSLIGFTEVLPSCAGRLLEKEIRQLNKIIKKPNKPSMFLFGGAKFSDAISTIDHLLNKKIADKILLTGLPANAFLKAIGYNMGKKTENILMIEDISNQLKTIKDIFQKYEKKIYLPIDFAISSNEKRFEISLDELPNDHDLFDIGEKTIIKYKKILKNAKTIFLSGPCGVFEKNIFQNGTKEIFNFIADSNAFSIAGGGHTVAAIEKLNLKNNFSHISTGGGSLEKFITGDKLAVIEALKKSKNLK